MVLPLSFTKVGRWTVTQHPLTEKPLHVYAWLLLPRHVGGPVASQQLPAAATETSWNRQPVAKQITQSPPSDAVALRIEVHLARAARVGATEAGVAATTA